MSETNQFFCNTAVDLPYPEVRTNSRNPAYAYEMLSNVGSSNSEMSAIGLYFYNSVMLNPEYESFARCFDRIGIVEMRHLAMFADLAFQMGLDPRLWSMKNKKMVYWTPAYINYPREIKAVIYNSIKGENAAIQKYREQADTIRDANIVAILERIILDEKRHIEIFNSMLEQIG